MSFKFHQVIAYTHDPSSRETEAGGLSCVQDRPGLLRKNLTENKVAVRAMAQTEKCSPCIHKDLRSGPRTQVSKNDKTNK